MEEKYVISAPHPDAGLGNRIKCLISNMRIATKLNRKLLLYWPKSFSCGADFSDLFENKFRIISDKEFKDIQKSEDSIRYDYYPANLDESKKYLLFPSWRFILLPGDLPKDFVKTFPFEDANSIEFEFSNVPKKLQYLFLSQLNKLKIKKSISQKVDEFIKSNGFKDVVGLHVRRNDNNPIRVKTSSNELFFKEIEKILNENPKERFFLATDSKKTEKLFVERYNDKILTFKKIDNDRIKAQTIEESLIELLILSKTKKILGSYLSTFTEIAWWFGGCKAEVKIIGLEYVKQPASSKRNILRKIFSSVVQSLRRNSSLFRSLLRLVGCWR